MSTSHARILLVDSNADAAQELRDILSHEGYEVSSARDSKSARRYFEQGSADLILTDLQLPQLDGLTFLTKMRTRFQNMPVVLMTANGSLRTAVEGLKAGAFDYLTKPFIVDEVRCVARRALEHTSPPSESPTASDLQPEDASPFGSLVGSSPRMVHVYKAIARVAQTDSTVLLQGESGTGKELIARAIHVSGPRSSGPFVTVDGGRLQTVCSNPNCSDMNVDLLPGRCHRAKASLKRHIPGPVFWTRSLTCFRLCKPSYHESSRRRRFGVSAAAPRRRWMCGLLRLPSCRSSPLCAREHSAKISIIE